MTQKATKIAQEWLSDADAVLITASNGLSISEGLNLFANDQQLRDVLGDLVDKYQLPNILTAMNYHYPNQLDKWRAISRVVEYYSNNYQPSRYMQNLKKLIADKPYFIWTSNVDHHFALAGLNHLLEIEGNWLEGVCSSHPKEHGTVNLAEKIHKMAVKDRAGQLAVADLPKCDECGAPLELNVAGPNFQMDQTQVSAFSNFIQKYQDQKLLVLELGIGPQNQLIKAPTMQMVAGEENSHYITINQGQLFIPDSIKSRSIGYSSSIDAAFNALLSGEDDGVKIIGPAKPEQPLTDEERAKQEKVMQAFYPSYMVDLGFQGGLPVYMTIDQQHPGHLHLLHEGRSWMYDLGDAAIVHCFTQDGHYYTVRLGLNKERGEVHGFYAEAGTIIGIENAGDTGAGFSQINTEIPQGSRGEIMIPRKEQLLKLFPEQRAIIERLAYTKDN